MSRMGSGRTRRHLSDGRYRFSVGPALSNECLIVSENSSEIGQFWRYNRDLEDMGNSTCVERNWQNRD